jgi:hypothetical protein
MYFTSKKIVNLKQSHVANHLLVCIYAVPFPPLRYKYNKQTTNLLTSFFSFVIYKLGKDWCIIYGAYQYVVPLPYKLQQAHLSFAKSFMVETPP